MWDAVTYALSALCIALLFRYDQLSVSPAAAAAEMKREKDENDVSSTATVIVHSDEDVEKEVKVEKAISSVEEGEKVTEETAKDFWTAWNTSLRMLKEVK